MNPETSIAFFDYQGILSTPPAPMLATLRPIDFYFIDSRNPLKPTHSISNRHTPRNLRQIQEWGIPAERRTLAVLETRVNDPYPFSRRASREYGSIIFASHYHTKESELFGWPWMPPPVYPEINRRNRIAMVNANKFSSAYGEQYSLRRAFLQEMVSQGLPIDLYGADWNRTRMRNIAQSLIHDAVHLRDQIRIRQRLSFSRSRYQSLDTQMFSSHGETKDKFQTLNQYRYSLVIENDPTFFTEKLMDSLACGCITFYLGPRPAATEGLPGVVPLPEDPRTAVNLIRNYLAHSKALATESQAIRDAAVTAFAQTAGSAWENLATRWLNLYADTEIP